MTIYPDVVERLAHIHDREVKQRAEAFAATTCTYDSGAMYGCDPLCSAPATHVVIYKVPCYGTFFAAMCPRHVKPMLGRVYPGQAEIVELKRS